MSNTTSVLELEGGTLEETLEDDAFEEDCNSFVALVVSLAALEDSPKGPKGRTSGCKNVQRERKPVDKIFSDLGPRLFRKCYRMPEVLFWKLHGLLQPYCQRQTKRKRGATPNGDIPSSAKLSMALRWFAGGGSQLTFFRIMESTTLKCTPVSGRSLMQSICAHRCK